MKSLTFHDVESYEPNCFWAYAKANRPFHTRVDGLSIDGNAVGLTYESAKIRAIGEAVERYAAGFRTGDQKYRFGTANEVQAAIDPSRFISFDDSQYIKDFPFSRPSTSSFLEWVPGENLVSKAAVYVPSQLVYIPHQYIPEEARLDDQISSGLACHISFEKSATKSILEVLERDAFMRAWRLSTQPTFAPDGILSEPTIQNWLKRIEARGIEYSVGFLPDLLGASVAICVMRPRIATVPHFVCGLGSDLNPYHALLSAVEECVQSWLGLRRMAEVGLPDFDPFDITTFTSPHRHGIAFAVRPDLASEAWNRLSASVRPHMPHQVLTLDELLHRAAGVDRVVVVCDLTPPDVAKCGLFVTRALVSEALALDTNANWPHLGCSLKTQRVLNTLPHPFP